MEKMNIDQVAQQVGIQTSAIRYYESIGLIPQPQRKSGWRRYERDVLDRLSVIRTATDLGFKLDEIHILLDGFPLETEPSERWRALAAQKLPEVEDLITRATVLKSLLEAGVDCDCERIEQCITTLGQSCLQPDQPVVAAATCSSSCGG